MDIVDQEYITEGFQRKNTVVVAVEDGGAVDKFAAEFYLEKLHRPENFVTVVHVKPYHENLILGAVGNVNPGVDITANIEKGCPEFLAKLSEDLKSKHISHKILREFGEVGPSICTAVTREHAEYVVVGCKGRSSVKEFFKGTITGYVSHHSSVPVVIARSKNTVHRGNSQEGQHKAPGKDLDRFLSQP